MATNTVLVVELTHNFLLPDILSSVCVLVLLNAQVSGLYTPVDAVQAALLVMVGVILWKRMVVTTINRGQEFQFIGLRRGIGREHHLIRMLMLKLVMHAAVRLLWRGKQVPSEIIDRPKAIVQRHDAILMHLRRMVCW